MKKAGHYKNCEKCTTPFWAYPYNANKRRFCSQTCSNKSTNKQQSETKRKKSFTHKTNWRWSYAYIEWRNTCLARDNYVCQECKKDVSNNNMAIVHHPKSWRDFPDDRYDVSNGVTLCRSCHNRIHILPSRKERSGF